jgi:hypothetical protein
MPIEILHIIYDYLPLYAFMWLNKHFYLKYHYLLKRHIRPVLYDSYIRNVARNDNYFVFLQIVEENQFIWKVPKRFVYRNVSYSNYLSFITDFCIKNNSTNCRNILIQETGLSQNQHKKNRYLNIRWKI